MSRRRVQGADFVFSAIRVGGDRGRVIDEQVALSHGLVGQETTGAGGCAMALRTIPVVLSYCEVLRRCAPGAVLINFTNPAGVITQAISSYGAVRALGVCDTPSAALEKLAAFLAVEATTVTYEYSGLNHLGWISSFSTDGTERIDELLHRYEELQRYDHTFAAFDPGLVRRVGALPTEYLFYYYDAQHYVKNVRTSGTTRGQDVLRMNAQMLANVTKHLEDGDYGDAWAAYSTAFGLRGDTYMTVDIEGAAKPRHPLRQEAAGALGPGQEAPRVGGYEGVALAVVRGLTSPLPEEVIVNIPNRGSLGFLAPDDVVEVPALIGPAESVPRASGRRLPLSAVGLVSQVKEFERAIVEASVTGSSELAAVGLSLHPLVPGISAARELIEEYRKEHGPALAYLR